jgi:hypothetical protein
MSLSATFLQPLQLSSNAERYDCWPEHPCLLIPGINDTWNVFQKKNRGKSVSSADWKAARYALHAQYRKFLADGGIPNRDFGLKCRFIFCIYSLRLKKYCLTANCFVTFSAEMGHRYHKDRFCRSSSCDTYAMGQEWVPP